MPSLQPYILLGGLREIAALHKCQAKFIEAHEAKVTGKQRSIGGEHWVLGEMMRQTAWTTFAVGESPSREALHIQRWTDQQTGYSLAAAVTFVEHEFSL
jgi:hypothetical protein